MPSQDFFSVKKSFCIADIAGKTGARLRKGETGNAQIFSAAPIETAERGEISFIENVKYLKYLKKTSASAIFCIESHVDKVPENVCALIHSRPYEAYGEALHLLYPEAMRPIQITKENSISPAAYVEENVKCGQEVVVEAGCVIGSNVSIGKGSRILAGSIIGSNVQIGCNCVIGSRVTIIHTIVGDNVIIHSGASIGQDGFGFSMGADGHKKIPQIGRVIIQNDVEIGANTTIDRGTNRDTIIGEGSRIDNLVQIAHNVKLGKHCVIVGQVGIAGSATLEDFVVVAGQSGISGHITIGTGAKIGGKSAVYRDLQPGETVMGYPSIAGDLWMRKAVKIVSEEKRWSDRRKKK